MLDTDDVRRVQDVGGRLIVAPNMNEDVVRATVDAGMVSSPGFFTPTEAFAAIEAGAHALKLFPAEAASPAVVKALKAVLPKDIPLIVVGGVRVDNLRELARGRHRRLRARVGASTSRDRIRGETLEKARAFVAAVKR